MTDPEAKDILLRYRPGTPDDGDPEVRAALERGSRNPELAAWLQAHQRIQEGLRTKLRELPVPAGLKEQILSERASALRHWRPTRRLVLAGAVAALTISVVLVGILRRPDIEARFETFRHRMVRAVLRGYTMELATSDLGAIRAYLNTHEAHGDWESPPGLEGEPVVGCGRLTWRSRPAAMICYGKADQPELWLFVVDTAALADAPGGGELVYGKVSRLNTAAWSQRGRTYLLAAEVDRQELRRFVGER